MILLDLRSKIIDLYWRFRDRNIITKICDNPKTFLIYTPRETDKVFIDVYIKSGIAIEKGKNIGAGHLLEHYIAEHLSQKLQNEVSTNARIDHEYMYFYGKIDKKKPKEYVEKFFNEIFKPVFNNEDILEYEKAAIMNELNTDRHNLTKKMEHLMEETRFKGRCPAVIPFEESIEPTRSLTIETIQKHHEDIFNDQNVSIFISVYRPIGAFRAYLKKLLPKYALKTGKKTVFSDSEYSDRRVEKKKDENITGSYVYLTYPALVTRSPFREKMTLRIMLELLMGRDRVFGINKIARREGIYGINYYWMKMEKIGFLVFYSYVPQDQVRKLLQVIAGGIKALIKEPIDPKFLKTKIEEYATVYKRDWRSNERIDWLIQEELDYSRTKELDFYLREMNKITPADIQSMARRIFYKDKMNVVIYGETPRLSSKEIYSYFEWR